MSYQNLNTTSPYHVYVDINAINSDQNNREPVPLIFNEIRNNPILNNPSDYFLSVVRFSLETPTLPLLLPQVELGQGDADKLVYSFTMSYNFLGVNYEYKQNLIFVAQDKQQPTPNAPLVFQDLTSEYYYIYSFMHWMNIVNNALQSCYNGLNALVIGAGGTLPSTVAPFMEWDPYNNIAILNADQLGYARTLANPIKLYMNTSLYTLFSSFEATIEGFGANITNGKNFQIMIYSINNTNVYTIGSINYLQMYQEYSTTPLWCPVSSLVFTTGQIPVVPSNTSAPLIFNSLNQSNTGNNSNLTPQITDFEVPLERGSEYKPNVFYTPNSEYRMFDLIGNTPLSALQITVYWKDNYGGLHLFKLASGSTATIKLLFRRKAFNIATDRYLQYN